MEIEELELDELDIDDSTSWMKMVPRLLGLRLPTEFFK